MIIGSVGVPSLGSRRACVAMIGNVVNGYQYYDSAVNTVFGNQLVLVQVQRGYILQRMGVFDMCERPIVGT